MAPDCRLARGMRVFLLLVVALIAADPAHALRIVNYNITFYPSINGAGRDTHFRTVLAPLAPDIVVVQEMESGFGVNQFLANLNALEPGQWTFAPFYDGNDSDNALFYKPSKVSFWGSWPFYPNLADPLRYVTCWRLRPAGYFAASAELRIYSQHFKAGNTAPERTQRLGEATGTRDSMNAMAPGTHAILTGDFNIYASTEAAFVKLLEDQADDDGRLYDPLNAIGTWNSPSFAGILTQSPCSGSCPSGFVSGGLDDRFDMFLPTYNMNDGAGLDLLTASYKSVGNDGAHYNQAITAAPTIPEGAAYASALHNASDHLPIVVDVQIPARASIPGTLSATVIGTAGAILGVTNSATVPADELNYSFTAPSGFTAPAGSFSLNAGAGTAQHGISPNAGPLGDRSGTLMVASNDPDFPVRNVNLTVKVVDHAVASLDSSTATTSDTLDFGSHPEQSFFDGPVRIHNLGWDDVQARLSVGSAEIVGGAGRFSIVGGFTSALLSGTGKTYSIRFDGTGATSDSVYTATLIFHTADEPIPGATPLSDLTVHLLAERVAGVAGRDDGPRPGALRFDIPRPNPLLQETVFAFDLPSAADVALDVFDASGRRVASVASGERPAGRHQVRWLGHGEDGVRVPAGLYFVRFASGGFTATRRLAVLTR